MMSLFSSFDIFFVYFQYFFYIYFFSIIFMLNTFYSLILIFLKSFFSYLISFFYTLKPNFFNEGVMIFMISTFIFFSMMNLSSVFMYNFSFNSQSSVVFMFSMSFWLVSVSFYFLNNLKGFVSHCIPEGTPLPLIWLLFLIEIISNIIRPITLGVRLMSNIIAGHLLLNLAYSFCSKNMHMYFMHIFLSGVEIFVGIIQSYIFCTMCVLYYSDVS